MNSYGLTTEGFIIPTVVILRDSLNELLRATFGASLNLGDRSILGQFTGILAERLVALWEKLEAVNSAQDPDKAAGAALEALCALTGTFRDPATYSAVTLTLTGTPTTLVTAGNKSETTSTGKVFVHTAAGTIAAVSAWVASTNYVLKNRVHNGGKVYECTDPGISAGSGGPTGTGSSIIDNGVIWTFLGNGTGAIDVDAIAEESGPVTALARDINVKNTSVGGWDSVINLLDANEGRNVMTDGELRLRREEELATGGSATVDALRAELLEVPGVETEGVTIFVNNTDVTNVDGIPPHSIEAMIDIPAGTANDQLVFDALLAGVAAGIKTHGLTVGTAQDEQGTAHTMKFSRPIEIPIYINITVTADATLFPTDGAAQIKQAIVDWGDIQKTGKDAVAAAISAQAFTVVGVIDVTTCNIDDAPAPTTSATVAISLREIATYDTSRINVTVNNGNP